MLGFFLKRNHYRTRKGAYLLIQFFSDIWNFILAMLGNPYVRLGTVSLLPAAVSVILYWIDKKTVCGKMPGAVKQILYGIIFGALAVLGTEYGIPINGAQINCRDAAVLTAGLLFGAPAGIIAGLIGGVERWIAVAWGVGTFTRVACSLSTAIAGIYAALLRKFMFENKKPGWVLSFAIGIVMEVFHLTMVFITNMATPDKAIEVVKACSLPMITANACASAIATIFIVMISEGKKAQRKQRMRISEIVQRSLLITIVVAFALTTYFVYTLQTSISVNQREQLLTLATAETKADIGDAADANILQIARMVQKEKTKNNIKSLAAKYELSEISVISKDGIIVESTNLEYIGFDMHSGPQAAEFLVLLGDTQQFVQEYGAITSDPTISRKYAGIKTDDGFIQVGYDTLLFQARMAEQVIDITKNRHVGETGYVLIFDKNFDIVSAPEDFDTQDLSTYSAEILENCDGSVFEFEINKTPCFCSCDMTEGYYVVAAYPKNEAMNQFTTTMYVNTFMEVLVFALLFAFIYFLIKNAVVNQIKSINCSLQKITGGDLDETVNVRSNEEFASLSDDINSTVTTLKNYIEAASARIDKELEFAKSIQSSALPNVFPKRKDFEIFAMMNTAKEVGGDFYDFYTSHHNILNFLVADVSGKGIPAAMFMMRAKTELKSLTETDMPINEVFTAGNSALCEGNDAGMFVTAWQGSVNLDTGKVQYVSAGHNPPLVRHGDGNFEYLRSKVGFVLAGMDGVKYKMQEMQLSPGDIVFLYTDGVTEATNADNQLFGEDRLLETVNSQRFTDVKLLCETVKASVDAFVGEAPQFDDITMVGLKFMGNIVPEIHFDEAKIDDIPAVTEFVEQELEKLECPMKTIVQMNIAVDEIYSNIAKFAYPDGKGPVTVQIKATNDSYVHLTFIDEGTPYNPVTKEDPDITLSAEERNIGGLGIYMVKQTMDDMQYRYESDKNILTLVKKI